MAANGVQETPDIVPLEPPTPAVNGTDESMVTTEAVESNEADEPVPNAPPPATVEANGQQSEGQSHSPLTLPYSSGCEAFSYRTFCSHILHVFSASVGPEKKQALADFCSCGSPSNFSAYSHDYNS